MKPIGIFDSGIGGLTVAKAIAIRLPHVPLIYFGDTAHLPYGEKSPELIRHYASRISHHLRDQGCRIMVVACNSVSSNALHAVQDALGPKIPAIDVIAPVIQEVIKRFPGGRIGVIGTRATIESGRYQEALNGHGCEVTAMATPLLASAIEEGFHEGSVSDALLEAYLGKGTFDEVDALILGCTHYPLIASQIRAFLPDHVAVIDSSIVVANSVAEAMSEMEEEKSGKAIQRFLVSDLTPSFSLGAQRFFGSEVHLEESPLWDF